MIEPGDAWVPSSAAIFRLEEDRTMDKRIMVELHELLDWYEGLTETTRTLLAIRVFATKRDDLKLRAQLNLNPQFFPGARGLAPGNGRPAHHRRF